MVWDELPTQISTIKNPQAFKAQIKAHYKSNPKIYNQATYHKPTKIQNIKSNQNKNGAKHNEKIGIENAKYFPNTNRTNTKNQNNCAKTNQTTNIITVDGN